MLADEIVQQLLVDLGLGSIGGTWPVSSDGEPDTPDNCITVRTTTGSSDGRLANGQNLDHYGFSIRLRGADKRVAGVKIAEIRAALLTVYDQTVTLSGVGSYIVHAIVRVGQILPLGSEKPASRRYIYTLNAMLSVR